MSIEVNSEVFCEDCMVGMKRYPDGYFDLAICDPPFGLDFGKFNRTNKDVNGNRFKADKYHHGVWDAEIPADEYFAELFRVSKNQIICG